MIDGLAHAVENGEFETKECSFGTCAKMEFDWVHPGEGEKTYTIKLIKTDSGWAVIDWGR